MEGSPVTDGEGTARDLSWQTGVAVLGLFAVLAYAVRPVLTPFVLFLLFLHVAWPWLDRPIVSRLAVAGTALILLWIVVGVRVHHRHPTVARPPVLARGGDGVGDAVDGRQVRVGERCDPDVGHRVSFRPWST